MTDDNNAAIDANQIDDDILSYTVSDEALEAAAGIVKGRAEITTIPMYSWGQPAYHPLCC